MLAPLDLLIFPLSGTLKRPATPDDFLDNPLTRTVVAHKDGSKMARTQTHRSGGRAGVDRWITKSALTRADGSLTLTGVSVPGRKRD